ncbi:type II secretion system protein N [Sphingomonas floccifaciens]|uniref:Type II secretion system protein N n=1 Tax=Sphingomonas floccifaciens TaxID=1844115 RepID=A0ABW4N8U2_9SPHN
MILRRFDLTPYRQRIVLDVFTGAVVVSVAFALAGLTWRLAGHADVGAITVPPVRTAAPVPDLAPTLALAPFGRAGVSADGATPTTLPLVLKGIVFARPAELSIAYIQSGSEAMKPFKVGEVVGGATIAAIQINRVIVTNGGRSEFLAFPDAFAKPGAAGATSGAAPSTVSIPTTPPPVGNPVATSTPAPATPALPSAETVLQRMNATPTDGGYRVGAGAPTGMQQGDVVNRINGIAITSQDAVRAAIGNAQMNGVAEMQFTRNGRQMTVTVPFR